MANVSDYDRGAASAAVWGVLCASLFALGALYLKAEAVPNGFSWSGEHPDLLDKASKVLDKDPSTVYLAGLVGAIGGSVGRASYARLNPRI